MAYITGTAATFADLQTALQNACTANGWTLSSGILSKNGCFFKLSNASNYLQIDGGTGQSGSTLTGAHTAGARLISVTGYAISFPLNYEIHVFTNPDEVYCVINYNSDFYQQLSFGKSDVPGIGGTGAWFTGAFHSTINPTTATSRLVYWTAGVSSAGVGYQAAQTVGLFAHANNSGSQQASFVHAGLDSVGWKTAENGTAGTGLQGMSYASGLLTAMPNLGNNANVLIPVKAIQFRFDNGRTVVANPRNVRYMRIDNVVPGEIITFGAEQWKCYPFHRKDATVRDGVAYLTGAQHSGTWGYAIKYTGS